MIRVKNKGKVVGVVNKVTNVTLVTRGKPFCVAVPNKYHGLKKKYFATLKEAKEWASKEVVQK